MTRHLITSALPYINGVKHLGNLIGSMLPADVYAKRLRQQGEEVLFICGTDEHGTPAELAAQEAHQSIQDYCAAMHERQRGIYEAFDINFDFFGRSSAKANHVLTQEIFKHLDKNGYLEERDILQYYSIQDQRFLPDRFVEGICPHCSYAKARGDQCDGCGSLLDPADLLEPRSAISGSREIHLEKSRHIFLRLDKLQDQLEIWVKGQVHWSDVAKGIARKWLQEGLKPRCITRDLTWGVPVPKPGFEGKVLYVWFDAPNAYISMTQEWAEAQSQKDAWKRWWLQEQKGSELSYVQFMAKDNVAFHAIFWPAILFATGVNWKQVDNIKSFHWLNYDKGKFSTSMKRGVFSDEALSIYPADYWRYYLLASCPETSDSDFTFAHFASVINRDLADTLGNFVSRSLTLMQKYFELQMPIALAPANIDHDLIARLSDTCEKIAAAFHELRFRVAMQMLKSLWIIGNEYITERKPWTTVKTDIEATQVTLVHCVHLLRLFAVASYSVIPNTARELLRLINDTDQERIAQIDMKHALNFSYFQRGHLVQGPLRLFQKIEDSQVLELTERFAGSNR